nr:ribonuclease H-like domain, reverse transcriptase, RNA-dependent DNA polymerase [Tanacetum cinerariifolium]
EVILNGNSAVQMTKDEVGNEIKVKHSEEGIFISHDKYVAEILKKFDFSSIKTASTPIETQKPLVKDEDSTDVDVHLYRSMIGSLMYLIASRPDIIFTCKKQAIVATSTIEAKYVAATNCCRQMGNNGDKLVSAAGFGLYFLA